LSELFYLFPFIFYLSSAFFLADFAENNHRSSQKVSICVNLRIYQRYLREPLFVRTLLSFIFLLLS